MFAFLRGFLHQKSHGQAVLDVGGVGYDVRIPLSTFYELGTEGEPASLRITTLVREDSIALYGFLTEGEQRLFELLISVSGVGARTAGTTGRPPEPLSPLPRAANTGAVSANQSRTSRQCKSPACSIRSAP